MFYSEYELARKVKSMIQNNIYEDVIYVDLFNYEGTMETRWEEYKTDYPILIKATNIEVERIKEVFEIKDENIVELNKEKGLYLCEKTKNDYITNNTRWFLTTKVNEEYVEEDFVEKVKEYTEKRGKGVNNEKEVAEVLWNKRVAQSKADQVI